MSGHRGYQREAVHWRQLDGGAVQCLLCPHRCRVAAGKAGLCRARVNEGGRLYAANYGQVTSCALDPIEKKPLYHFYPGSHILSYGTWGCNLRCVFCQNWTIAHGSPPAEEMTPRQAVDMALEVAGGSRFNVGIAYTYSEPLVWYEFVLDTARLARQEGLKNVLVTNGYVNEEPLLELLPYIDAMNIDVKSFSGEYYREMCRGSLEPVLETVELASRHCHVEVTALLVTGKNDSAEEISWLVDWLAGLDPEIPLHFSRYFPSFELNLPPTPVDTLLQAKEIASKKLSYVYLGNVPQLDAGSTYCPGCREELISRIGYYTRLTGLEDGKCSTCGRKVKVVY